MVNGFLLTRYGQDGVESLFKEIAKYPEILAISVGPSAPITRLKGEARVAWDKVVQAMQFKHDDQVTSDACWRSYRSIRFKYILSLRNPIKHPMRRWQGMFPFLDKYAERNKPHGGSAVSTAHQTSPSRASSSRSAKSTPDSTKNWRAKCKDIPLIYEFGKNCVKLLFHYIAQHPELHDYDLVRKHQLETLPAEYLAVWNEVMAELNKSYPDAASFKAWRAWRNVRMEHHQGRCSKSNAESLAFLAMLDGSPNEPQSESEILDTFARSSALARMRQQVPRTALPEPPMYEMDVTENYAEPDAHQLHDDYQDDQNADQLDEDYHDDQSGYHDDQSGYQDDQSGYQDDQSGYQDDQSGYHEEQSGYQDEQNGYEDDDQNGHYNDQGEYVDPQAEPNYDDQGYYHDDEQVNSGNGQYYDNGQQNMTAEQPVQPLVDETFRNMLKLIVDKINRHPRSSEIALNTIRRRSLEICNNLHDIADGEI